MTNSLKLRQRIEANGVNIGILAKLLKISRKSLKNKINGKEDFTDREINILVAILGLAREESNAIFFPSSVREIH